MAEHSRKKAEAYADFFAFQHTTVRAQAQAVFSFIQEVTMDSETFVVDRATLHAALD